MSGKSASRETRQENSWRGVRGARHEKAQTRHEIRIVELPESRRIEAAPVAALAWDVAPAPGVLEARLSGANVRVNAALDRGGHVVGVATARILAGGRAVSDETAVVAAWRGRGIASALLDALVERLRGAGVRVLEGETSGARLGELAFFRQHGFRVTGAWFAFGVEGYAEGEMILRTEKRL